MRQSILFMLSKRFLAGALFSFISFSLVAQEMKYSEVKISVPKSRISTLWEYGLAFDHFTYDEKGKYVSTVVNQDDIALMKKHGVKFTIVEADAVEAFQRKNKHSNPYQFDDRKHLKKINARLFFESPDQPFANSITTPAAFMNPVGSMGGYYTLAEVYNLINTMRTNYPNLVKIDTIGWTFGGNRVGAATPRPIWCVKISDNVSTDEVTESESMITGLNHAREGMSMMNIIFYMQYLLENYSTNQSIKELVDNRQMYFIPVNNPDGYKYNEDSNPSGGGLHRKNRTTTNVTTNIGTDINRNYELGWNEIGIGGTAMNPGSSTTTTSDVYRGPSAMSELESQAMRDFLRTRRIKMNFNHHAYAEAHIHPACVSSVTISAADASFFQNSSALMTKFNLYNPGNPFTSIGAVARGSNDDYFFAGDLANRGKIYSYSPEIGPNGGGIGGSSFWPLQANIIPYAKAMFYSNYQLCLMAGAYTRIEDRSPANITLTNSSFNFRVYRMGVVDSATTVSIIPLENIQTVGAPVNIAAGTMANHMDASDGSISYTLSGSITNGQRIRFIWRTVTGGITQTDTVTRFFNGNTTGTTGFIDDMETGTVGTNWVVSSGWNYSTATMGGTGAFSGSRSLAESPAAGANYTSSATLTARINRTFNFSTATMAYMTFWLKHRAENGNDRLRVQVSTDGGTNWTSLSGRKTIVENAKQIGGIPSYTGIQDQWVREYIDLQPYVGQTSVQLRFQFLSNTSVVNDGFFIDDVAVVSSSASSSLPVEFISFTGKIQQQTSVLNWDASMDDTHNYFVVERSIDKNNFTEIGTVNGLIAPFSFTDNNPLPGINYYRIRQVAKDGAFKFSTTIALNHQRGAVQTKLYPSVTSGAITIDVTVGNNKKIRFDYIDEYGRMIMQTQVQAVAGSNRISQNVSALSAGMYYVKIVNEQNELISVEKFVKQN